MAKDWAAIGNTQDQNSTAGSTNGAGSAETTGATADKSAVPTSRATITGATAASATKSDSEELLVGSATIDTLEKQLNETETELAETKVKASDYLNKLMRAEAEKENILRRAERDISNAHKFAIEKFSFELLAVVDNLERGLAHKPVEIIKDSELLAVYSGVELTLKLFLETLQKFGITQINPLNQIFDPTYHTAMTTRPAPAGTAPNTVLEVMQKGYLLKDRLLRPAMVVVSG